MANKLLSAIKKGSLIDENKSSQSLPAWAMSEKLYGQRFFYNETYMSTSFCPTEEIAIKKSKKSSTKKIKKLDASSILQSIQNLSAEIEELFPNGIAHSEVISSNASHVLVSAIQPLYSQLNKIIETNFKNKIKLSESNNLNTKSETDQLNTKSSKETVQLPKSDNLNANSLKLKSNIQKTTKSTESLWNLTDYQICFFNRLHLLQFLVPNSFICGLCDSETFFIHPGTHVSTPLHKKTLNYWIHSRIPDNLLTAENQKLFMLMEKIHVSQHCTQGSVNYIRMSKTEYGVFECSKCPLIRKFICENDAVYHSLYGHPNN